MAEVDDAAWGNWLAGFADGEGCFVIGRHMTKYGDLWSTFFTIILRDDDRAILEELSRRYGGVVRPRSKPRNPNSNPQFVWQVSKVSNCLELVALFRRYPLRAKKRRDFDIWALAVEHLAQTSKGRRSSGRNHVYLRSLYSALRATRAYDIQPEIFRPENQQSGFDLIALGG